MFEFIEIGEKLIATFDRIGDWLLFQPFSIAEAMGFQQSSNYSAYTNWLLGVLEKNQWLLHLNVGSILLGSMLTFVLGYRLVKFFFDIL